MEHALAQASDFPGEEPGAPGRPPATLAELVLDSHRVVGRVQHGVAARRLVDILNGVDGPYAVVWEAALDDPFRPDEPPQRFPLVQVHRDAILFGIPREAAPPPQVSGFEAVPKVAVPAVLLLPGFRVSGCVFLPPGAEPPQVPLLGSRSFIPMKDVVVQPAAGRGPVWREPLVVVNLARVLVYGPGPA